MKVLRGTLLVITKLGVYDTLAGIVKAILKQRKFQYCIQYYVNIIIDDMLVWVAVEESQCKHRLHCCTIIASTIPNFGGEKRGVRLAWYILTFSILQNVSTVRQSCHKLKPIGLYQRVSKFVGALTSIHNVLI